MRTSVAGVAFLLAGAGAGTVAALTSGNGIALNGSDTLFDVTTAVLTACTTAGKNIGGDTYKGGGSGVGVGAMKNGAQEIAPMSKAMSSGDYCAVTSVPGYNATTNPNASSHLAADLLIALDGISIVANTTSSCSTSTANGVGLSTAMTVTDDGTGVCPGCSGGAYTFANSIDALKVLYFGLHNDSANTYNCASPVRKTLIHSWNNLFQTACSGKCPSGLTHAWRRDDLAGTTDAFVALLAGGSLPTKAGQAVGIGSLKAYNAAGGGPKINPFCNSVDAQVATASTTAGTRSNPDQEVGGTYNDFADLDPVRTDCQVLGTALEDVCGPVGSAGANNAGSLGVVLSVLLPDSSYVQGGEAYQGTTTSGTVSAPNAIACSGTCIPVAPANTQNLGSGFHCPGGNLPTGGTCLFPSVVIGGVASPECYSDANKKCSDTNGFPDGRAYNLPQMIPASQAPGGFTSTTAYQYGVDANFRFMAGSFHRVHSRHPGIGAIVDSNRTGLCLENDATSQIGCLADSDACSVGFAGREAAKDYPGGATGPQVDTRKALAINGGTGFVTPFALGSDPDANIKALFTGTGSVYPLSRRLYLATVYGFNTANIPGGEANIVSCFETNSIVNAAVSAKFVPVPPATGFGGGVKCLDYPENLGTATPTPNTVGSGSEALGGCGLGGTNTDACSAVTILP